MAGLDLNKSFSSSSSSDELSKMDFFSGRFTASGAGFSTFCGSGLGGFGCLDSTFSTLAGAAGGGTKLVGTILPENRSSSSSSSSKRETFFLSLAGTGGGAGPTGLGGTDC